MNDARGSNNTRCIDLFRNENGPVNGKQCIVKRLAKNTKFLPNRDPERRAHQRHEVHKVVPYTHGQKHLLTLTLDLAFGGMKIKTDEKLPKNERLKFKMILGKDSITSEGRVVYTKTRPGGQHVSGIQFLGLSRRGSTLLRAYLFTLEESPQLQGTRSPSRGKDVILDTKKF